MSSAPTTAIELSASGVSANPCFRVGGGTGRARRVARAGQHDAAAVRCVLGDVGFDAVATEFVAKD